jgi:predicted aldo/keto reductase-like oxidoreductase
MIYKDFQGKQLSALGLGCMRFPVIDGDSAKIDEAATAEMVDYAFKHGINYFDTAFGYHGGTSEPLMGKLLSKYPRESYFLASKFPGYYAENLRNKEQVFASQLQRCQTEYFDFYLCHSVSDTNIEGYLDPQYGLLDYLKAEKAAGRIRHLGFSCHSSLENMERFIKAADGAIEFCQIQLNWLDWTLQDAKAKVEMLNKYNIPIWVMEPVRGGMLAKLKDTYREQLAAVAPERTAPQWAFRFLQSLPGVTMTLSGMSNMEQLQQNIATYAEAQPLSEAEMAALLALARELSGNGLADVANIKRLGEGWVGDEALAVAVCCVLRYHDDMEECLSAAVTHDGDSDSTGAIAGNILGAWLGVRGIPSHWLERLEMREVIDDMAIRLYEAANK